jgi:glycogen debranching enzyme
MDAVIHGKPVTPRIGYDVEINALWYNAVQFALELARNARDSRFISHGKRYLKKQGNRLLNISGTLNWVIARLCKRQLPRFFRSAQYGYCCIPPLHALV